MTATTAALAVEVGDKAIVLTKAIVYTGVITGLDDEAVTVRIDTKMHSREYRVTMDKVLKITRLGAALSTR